MPFDERKAFQEALKQAQAEFVDILEHIYLLYPDVLRKGPAQLTFKLPAADTDREMRRYLEQITDPDEWLKTYQDFAAQYGDQRAQEMLMPRRTVAAATQPQAGGY